MLDFLTHERLNHKFKNNFDLTNFAINFARKTVAEDESISLNQILKELENLPDVEEKEVSYV